MKNKLGYQKNRENNNITWDIWKYRKKMFISFIKKIKFLSFVVGPVSTFEHANLVLVLNDIFSHQDGISIWVFKKKIIIVWC